MSEKVEYIIDLSGNLEAMLKQGGKEADNLDHKIGGLQGGIGKLAKLGAGLFAGWGVVELGKGIVSTLSNFERMEAVLTNTLGSNSAANQALADITKFAAETPFAVEELQDAYLKLTNRGLQPTMEQMTLMGDVASSVGKDFGMLTEAILDATTGEFERLKEFGIKASKNGEKISFTFKGQKTVVQNTEKAINDYIMSLGHLQGVQGNMAAQMDTTGGRLSNLGDMWTQLELKMGVALEPVITAVIGWLMSLVDTISSLITWMQNNSDTLENVAWVFGIAGAAILAYNGYVWASTAATKMMVLWEGIATIATGGLSGAFAILNVVMMANPIGLIIAAIAALVVALMWAWKKFAAFRGFVFGIWETIKGFFSSIGQFFHGLFTGNWEEMKEGMRGASIVRAAEHFQKGFDDGLKDFAADNPAEAKKTDPKGAQGPGTKGGPGAGGKGLGSAAGSVAGSAPKNLYINIHSLIENFTIQTTNVKQGMGSLKSEVSKTLLEVVNDINIAGS
jgi:hypothetical protein